MVDAFAWTTPSRLFSVAAAGLVLALHGAPVADAADDAPAPVANPAADDAVARGAYIYRAAGCASCHTDRANEGPELGGGVALNTPFGTFHAPNISPHPEHGVGGWSDEDFIRALREGRAPDGTAYYPSFPYTSYTGMTEQDMRDLKAYILAQEPVDRPNRAHELGFPYRFRLPLPVWQYLFLEPGPLQPDPERSETWNRGAYLVEALGHCGECHTPRNALGARDQSMKLAGTADGPEGKPVPNITPDPETGIGRWSKGDLVFLLELGMMPDGDFVGGGMGTVVRESTSQLTPADREAIAEYLLALPPIEHAVAREEARSGGSID